MFSFFVVLVSPLVMHWKLGRAVKHTAAGEQELIIITAHQEGIRREFADAFSRYHLQKFGEPVEHLLPDLRRLGHGQALR